MWNVSEKKCVASKMALRGDSFSDELFNEFDWISPSTFKLVTYDESDGVSYVKLEKCRNGDCVSFSGEYISANFHNFRHFLNNPFNYITCESN